MKTKLLLSVMKVISGILCISICIKAGAIIISSGISFFGNQEAAKKSYLDLNLSALYNYSTGHYIAFVLLMILTTILKAYFFYLVIRIFSKVNLDQPFSLKVAELITKISYVALVTGIVALVGDIYIDKLFEKGILMHADWGSAEFLYMAGIIFIIALLFKRGIKIQMKNDDDEGKTENVLD